MQILNNAKKNLGELLYKPSAQTRHQLFPFGILYIWYICKNMPPAKKLSAEEIREIVDARGKESPASIRKRFGIGTTRLYRIWKDAAAIEPTQNKPKNAVEPKQAAETETEQTSELLYQILDNVHDLQKNMDLLLGLQESHFEDVEDIGADLHGLEVGVEETKDGILQSIEKNSNAVREKTDRIVGAANATISAACGVAEAVGLVLGLGGVALLLWVCGSRKLEQWKAAQSDTPPEKEQLDTPPEKYLPPKKELLAVHKGVRALE